MKTTSILNSTIQEFDKTHCMLGNIAQFVSLFNLLVIF